MGSHHDRDRPFDPVFPHRLDRLGYGRRRVLHPQVGAELIYASLDVQAGGGPVRLLPRDLKEREPVTDRLVAGLQIRQVLRRWRPAAADVRVVALDVVGPARGPVRHE